jgi:pyridoxine 4-dehydrogenase
VLAHCERKGIGFVPWFPLGAGALTEAGAAIDKIAKRHGATPAQIVLAWTLRKSPVMLPIPGTSRVDHLEENVAASRIVLAPAEMEALDGLPAHG